ncbi:EAL domain-containing protein [Aestuariirhabdus sp. Z084]|uniref:putative bifunctional diguanylate cyclase/phosphodiesterase n=1 Tax=Aestuariirhabdus haliotis TaxID=2918751 RepID=UPI00201B3777|nr:EAL domain-containing protein [Aestuariirhabdus haliotis]MCL6416560.1 EAL domain-containing protein [Aestuariirhabdus haliotis]MCL6420573.1 EAL domain-containing protein [Aestuariirhabdus haliotis]
MPSALSLLLVSTDQRQFSLLRKLLASHSVTHRYQLYWCPSIQGAIAHLRELSTDLLLIDETVVDADGGYLTLPLDHLVRPCPVILLGENMGSEPPIHDRLVIEQLSWAQINAELLSRVIRYSYDLNLCRHKMQRQVQNDPLTGLPNRFLFRNRLQRAMDRADRDGTGCVLIGLDIDGFRKVNESYGHMLGDRLIQTVAERLLGSVRRTDSVGRTSGDEFAIILERTSNSTEVLRSVKKIVAALAEPLDLEEHQVSVYCSIGICSYPDGADDIASLVNNAELAMKEAKKQKGNSYQFYSDEFKAEAVSLLHLESELRRAIRLKELRVHYQPRIDVKTERVVGVEALVRWQHPSRGLLSPMEFIPLAEECGLIVPLGYWVLHQACLDMGVLASAGFDQLHVAVNLSFHQFNDQKLQSTISNIVRHCSADVSRLEFELTETAVMQDPAGVMESMQKLSQQGIQFSLDDFGTGYSSFSHLQELPIQTLKIDRSFISNLQNNDDNQVIVRAMISLAHKLNLKVVAEGVDHLSQAEFLNAESCDQIQGFLYSKPITLNSLMQLLGNDQKIKRRLRGMPVSLQSSGMVQH